MQPPTPPEEIADLMKFVAEKSKNVNSPLSIRGLARQYKEYSGSSKSSNTFAHRIRKYCLEIHEMNEFDVDTKAKMIFALSAPVDNGFLIELKKTADVEVDDRQRIIEYKKKGGGLELSLKSALKECYRKILEFLEEKSKTVKTPMVDYSFVKEFKSATGDQRTLETIRHRYSSAKETIYKSSKFNKTTKVKMMFISNAKITGNVLNELRKCARVEVDERGRITKYEAKDGSLKLEGIHGNSSLTMRECYDKMLEFLEEKSKTVNTPMMDTLFVKEFKSATGDQSTFRSLESRYARVKDKLYKSSTIGQDAKIKMMFISNAKISETILNELQKDAIVELDEKQRIKKYEAKDGSLSLGRKRGPPVKMRPKKDYWEDSSDSEDEESEEDDENMETSSIYPETSDKEEAERNERIRQSAIGNKSQGQSGIPNDKRKAESLYLPSGLPDDEGEEEENDASMGHEPIDIDNYGDDFNNHLPDYHHSNNRNPEEKEMPENENEPAQSGIPNDKRKALYLPSGFSEDELSADDNQLAMINGRKKARILFSSSEESENDEERGDGGEEVPKRARISYSSSGESEKKLSDEDESEKSMDLEMGNVAVGEEDNDYDPPSFNQYEESDSVRMEDDRSHQDSSNSKTNEKNPVNITTASDSNILSSSSSSEENSEDESKEKKMPPPTLPEEIVDLMKFIAEKSKNVNSPINVSELARQFKKDSGSSLTVNGIVTRIRKYRLEIHEMNEFDVDTKMKMIFALGAPVDDGFLKELKKTTDVGVDDQQRIIEYKKKGGGLELSLKTAPKSSLEECYDKMLEFLEEKSKTVKTPMVDYSFVKEFKSTTADKSTLSSLNHRYARAKDKIYKSSKFNRNTKVKMMFISNAKITGDILNELQKDAIVELDQKQRIIKYESMDGSLKLEGIRRMHAVRWHAIFQKVINEDDDSDVDEEDFEWIKLFRYVIEQTKNVKAPLNITKLALDYKRESGCSEQLSCITNRINSFRQRIGEMDVFDTHTKVRCLFALSARLTANVLIELQKDAVVELDKKRRIKKYEAKDGSLKLEGMPFDRWRAACQKVINDDDGDEEESDEEEEEEDRRLTNEYIKLIRYVIERTKIVDAPLRMTKLAQDFKKESRSLEGYECIYTRIKTFRQRIGEMDVFDTPTKVRCLFALSATITADVLLELEKDALVELDQNRRIGKYEAKNGSLHLEGRHERPAKLRAESEDLKDSSDSEGEESEEKEEERNERIREPEHDEEFAQSEILYDNRTSERLPDDEGEENEASTESDDFNNDLPDYLNCRNPEDENEADLSSMAPESIDFVDHEDDYDPSNSQQNQESIQEEDSEQVPKEKEPQGPLEDQIVAETISDALIIVQIIEQIVESVDVELRAHQIQNRISEDHAKAKRARISYSSSAESEKKQPDEDESEKSMDFGEEDIVYDLPNYHQYEEMFHEEIIQKSVEERDEIGEERSEFASSSSETNQKNPVNITASESNFEGNSGDESEKEESVKSKDLPPEPINFIDNGDDYEERIQEENSEQVPKETEPQGPLEDQNAALMTSQILEQAAESIEQKPEHLIENVQQERKRARMLDSVPEESINKLKRYCIELKEPKPENLIELPQEIRSESTSVRDILFLLKASLMAIESTKLIGLLKEIESIMEKLDNGSLQVTLDNINDPFELSFFPLIHHLAPKGPTKEETTSLYHFLVSLKTVTFQISHPTIHLLRQKLKTLIGELRVEDKRIPIHLIDIAMKTTIEMITSGSSN